MNQYYWRNKQKVEIERIPGSFGVGLASLDLASKVSEHFTKQGYLVLPTVKNRLIMSGADSTPEELRRNWLYNEIKYITFVYQDGEDRIFPTDELRIEATELSALELERLSKLEQIAEVTKKEDYYECRLICSDGDKGLQVYQTIYEVLKLPVAINLFRMKLRPEQ